jgi:hypothetical protein
VPPQPAVAGAAFPPVLLAWNEGGGHGHPSRTLENCLTSVTPDRTVSRKRDGDDPVPPLGLPMVHGLQFWRRRFTSCVVGAQAKRPLRRGHVTGEEARVRLDWGVVRAASGAP